MFLSEKPWQIVAREVIAGKWNKADDSTKKSLRIGLRFIEDRECKLALELLNKLGSRSSKKIP
jgi:hypothetical protein